MKMILTPATMPDEYIGSLTGWQQGFAEALRNTAWAAVPALQERLKWGHPVCFSNGRILIIRAELRRVLFGCMRGQRLRHIEPRLKPGEKYETELHTGRSDARGQSQGRGRGLTHPLRRTPPTDLNPVKS